MYRARAPRSPPKLAPVAAIKAVHGAVRECEIMMALSVYGRLGREPRAITTRTGKAMTVASIAVTVPSREDGETVDATQWVSVSIRGGAC